MPIRIIPIKATGPVMDRGRLLAELTKAVRDQQAEGVRFMAEYPPARGDSWYKRTGTLKRSWHAPPVRVRGDSVGGDIASQGQIAPYNRKVQGEEQDPFFASRGWRGVEVLATNVRREFPPRVQAAVNRAARK